MMKQNPFSGILLATGFLLLTLYGAAPLFLPRMQSASIPADRFSAERAMLHVNALSQSPRVAGTSGTEQAAAYVMEALRTCGLEPEIQEAASHMGTLRNIITRLPGSQPGHALLIVSHLDSVSYGAGDNASGSAVLLETACALVAGASLRNDVILLFDDGEESGYLGGYAFAKAHPSISSIRGVIGLDTAAWGPVVLLQTTPGNADFITAYARAVKNPTAFGFFADADWTISKDSSEIQPFYDRGIPGLELEDPTAFSGKHSNADTVEKIQPGFVQQMGDQALALAKTLGGSDLNRTTGYNLSFFTLWGLGVVHYPVGWNMALAVFSAFGLAILILRGIMSRVQTVRSIFLATAFLIALTLGAAACGAIGSFVFSYLFPNPNPDIGSYLVPASLPFFVAVLVLIVSGYLIIRAKLARRFGSPVVTVTGLSFWLLLSIVTASALPVGSYLFALPLPVAVFAAFLPSRWKFVKILPAAIATILIAPNVILAFLGTGMQTLVLVTLLMMMNAELWANFSLSDKGTQHG